MAGLVLELQRDALDRNVKVDDLLRKAYAVSRKLELTDMQKWIQLELRGYESISDCPNYRIMFGEIKFRHPRTGWQPVYIQHSELEDKLRSRPNCQSVGELQDLLRNDSSTLHASFLPNEQALLMEVTGARLEFSLLLSRQHIVKILDAVRTTILDWSLDLESQKIMGDGLTFSKEEAVTAKQINYNTTNHIGSMNNSQLQQHSSGTQTLSSDVSGRIGSFVEAATKSLPNLGLSEPTREELEAELATLRSQLKSPKPKLDIFRSCLTSAKTILEGAAGNVAASALLAQLVPLIPALGL